MVITATLTAVWLLEDKDAVGAIAMPTDVFEACLNGDVLIRRRHIVVPEHALGTRFWTFVFYSDSPSGSLTHCFIIRETGIIPLPAGGAIAAAELVGPVRAPHPDVP
jgi:hypothetical protein